MKKGFKKTHESSREKIMAAKYKALKKEHKFRDSEFFYKCGFLDGAVYGLNFCEGIE